MCRCVVEAWNFIDPEIIVRSFKKCGIPNGLDGAGDDPLWQDTNDTERKMEDFHDILDDNLNGEVLEELLTGSESELSLDAEEYRNIFLTV